VSGVERGKEGREWEGKGSKIKRKEKVPPHFRRNADDPHNMNACARNMACLSAACQTA
jgi:hypothetical protein